VREVPGVVAVEHVPQFLSVWNPYYEPQTIAEHVNILRAGKGHVWWGRIKEGTQLCAAQAREKWPEVARIAAEARAAGRTPTLFVTDFQSLHALRVEEVRFGEELPPGEEELAPSYYRVQRKHVPLWFRVSDVKAISHDRLTTLRYFAEELGPVAAAGADPATCGSYHYDPFASCTHLYPIVVPGPPTEAIFGAAPRTLRGRRVTLHADLPETLFPPEIGEAYDQLAGSLGGETWGALEEKSKSFLATAWVIHRRHSRVTGFDHAVIVTGLARALEAELWEGIADRLQLLAERERLATAVAERTRPDHRTLGAAARHLLPAVVPLARDLGLPRVEAWAANREWGSWLGRFVDVRNRSSHAGQVPIRSFRRHWEQLLPEHGDSRFVALAAAKRELVERLAGEPAAAEGGRVAGAGRSR
jgi:hypothetical protein